MKVKYYPGSRYAFVWCPGCDQVHLFVVDNGNGDLPPLNPQWDWDRNMETPTFSPSMLVNAGQAHPGAPICHSFLRNGVWEFLTDNTHHLAGQNVPMVDVPDWLAGE